MDYMTIVQSWNLAVAGLLVAAQTSPENGEHMRELAAELQLLASRIEGAEAMTDAR